MYFIFRVAIVTLITMAILAIGKMLYKPILIMMLAPFAYWMTGRDVWPNWLTLAIAFQTQHPICVYYGEREQKLITAVAITSLKEHLPNTTDEEKRKWIDEFMKRKNLIARWFWSLKK